MFVRPAIKSDKPNKKRNARAKRGEKKHVLRATGEGVKGWTGRKTLPARSAGKKINIRHASPNLAIRNTSQGLLYQKFLIPDKKLQGLIQFSRFLNRAMDCILFMTFALM